MDEPSSSSRSIGMHIDHAIESFHSLNSTQLYTLIVGLIVLLTCYLLGSAPLPLPSSTTLDEPNVTRKVHLRKESDGPEPRWHYFRYVSFAVVGLFSASVLEFGLHARAYMRDSGRLLQFLVGWSICLCYFFAFFGVSFVYNTDLGLDDEDGEDHQESVQLQQQTKHESKGVE
jgi:hypothetical protein